MVAVIPVLGVPILNGPELLDEMLASIDEEIGTLVIIDNGGVVDPGHLPPGARLIKPGHNLGVGASWNLVIQVTPKARWWMLANHDISFAPQDLARLRDHMESQGELGMVALLGTFSAFGIDRHAVKKAGFFDENFHPAYFEDNDYDYRCRLTGVPMAGLPAGLSHKISSTLLADPALRSRNHVTFPMNGDYYRAKWGGPPRGEVYMTPFDSGEDPRSWRLDVDRLSGQAWP